MKAKHLIFLVAAIAISYAVREYLEEAFPSSGSPTELVARLDSRDLETVVHGFHRLTRQADPVAVPRALQLLESPDESIWLNSALYLGACNRSESVPYLIKSLRHTSSQTDKTTAAYLKALTGQDLGSDFVRWQNWWQVQPGHRFDFDWRSSLGNAPRIQSPPRKK